jgi:hypothetical protein
MMIMAVLGIVFTLIAGFVVKFSGESTPKNLDTWIMVVNAIFIIMIFVSTLAMVLGKMC